MEMGRTGRPAPPNTPPPNAWGRDDRGSVWFARGREGFRWDPDEKVPEPLAIACDLRSMRVETLLRDVLSNFNLRSEGVVPGKDGPVEVIHATRKPKSPSWGRLVTQSARLEVNVQTKELRRVVLHRTYRGKPAGTVTFTYVESRPHDKTSYRLEGHLDVRDPQTRVHTRDNADSKRFKMFRHQFRPDDGKRPGARGDGKK
jgi:hypothetical protein